LHDKFSIIAFSFGINDKSAMRSRLMQSFDQFIDVSNKSDIEIVRRARELQIDIAVDLTGYTYGCRSEIFAYRVAPIQVSYLGYPGTTGAKFMDYVIADKIVIPSECINYFSEKIVFLPNSYQANDRKRPISERQFSRKELGLPEKAFVFACFNSNYKILPNIFDIWMEILSSINASVLWLFHSNELAMQNLKKEAKNRGIEPDRIIFAERLSLADHLARHAQADLFLDTFPYGAHTTASDALWAGLPILTLEGQSFASRVAASLLISTGMSELITTTKEDYKNLAIELAKHPIKLSLIRKKLTDNRLRAPLFDAPLFTQHLESAYLQMFERYLTGIEPDNLWI
jgi:predicted O-linked N-acetylglucosamine transferase (SPINDLY family)